MARGLIAGEFPLDVAKTRGFNGGRGLVKYEQIRKRFIRPRYYWGNPVNPTIVPTGFVTYPIIGGSYYPT